MAYVDATQLVIGAAELTTDGWHLFDTGRTYNVLGGEVQGPIHPAVVHRISHTVLDRDGRQWYHLDGDEHACGATNALCQVALQTPVPDMPYHEPAEFHVVAEFAVQRVTWTDPLRSGVLRRAVYVDDSYLMEAGLGQQASVRIWPARGLMAHGLELVTPTALEAGRIEGRIAQVTGVSRSASLSADN